MLTLGTFAKVINWRWTGVLGGGPLFGESVQSEKLHEMEETQVGPPRSFPINSLQELRDRSYFSSANFEFNRSSVPLQKPGGTSGEKRPRLLACHDLKGGYLDDQWIQGSQNADAYTLTHWRLLDIFVYFSHKLVTLPPPSWTNSAHLHGVQVLGTFITEWDDGASLCKELLASKESLRMYADRLAELAEVLGFDGWLINIENVIAKAQVANLQEFVRYLTVRMHSAVPGSLVIWYDSVTTEGKLEWQNWLNVLNKPFFDVCDGIFTNYTWRSDYPKLSASSAGDRAYDVYMGVDVFGRGSFGGGQFQCDVALKAAREAGVSAALFAPGWAYETNQDESSWWASIQNCWPAARLDPIQLPFFTDFDVGRGVVKCMEAKRLSDLPWNNLSCQNLQPLLHVAAAADSGVQFAATASQECAIYSGGVCIKAVGEVCHDEVRIVQLYHTETIIDEASLNVSYSVKTQSTDSSFSLALSAQDSKGSKVIYFLLDSKDDGDTISFPREYHFSHVSAVFEHVNEGHNSTTTGARMSNREGDSDSNTSVILDSLVSGGKWTVRDFILEWGNRTLVDIFGICSAAKDLRPILIKLLHQNEALFDGEAYAKQVRSTEQQSQFGRGGSSSMTPVGKQTPSKDTNMDYCLRLGHIRIAPAGHEHFTSREAEIVGYHPSWLVGEGGNRFLSVNLRWEIKTGVGSEPWTWTSRAYHLFVTVGRSDEDQSSATETYLGMTMLTSFYVFMLPLPKSCSSVTFNLRMQCSCGKVQPVSKAAYTLKLPTHQSGQYVRTQPSLSDWLFRESLGL